jgi:hypothetical protein
MLGTSHLERTFAKVKLNVSFSVFLTKHHTTNTYGGVEVYFHTFLISALYGGE